MQLSVVFGCVLLLALAHSFQPRSPSDHEIANTLRMAKLARSALPSDQQVEGDDFVDTACGVAAAGCLLGGGVDPACDIGTAACAGKAIGDYFGHLFG